MRPIYDSRDIRCKSPFGAVGFGRPVRFTICLPKIQLDGDPVVKLFEMDKWDEPAAVVPLRRCESSDLVYSAFSGTFVPEKAALLAYYFEVSSQGWDLSIKKGPDNMGVFDDSGGLWQLTVHDPDMRSPAPLREGMLYQIFPDRFFYSGRRKSDVPSDRVLRSEEWGGLPFWRPNAQGEVLNNDYFCGDLQGIMEKLDYLKSLGVTVIYLNPIFEAHSNHRYDTADFMNVDPLLGTNEDFRDLCAAAGEHGISVILDGVFNHTGSDSIYFNREGRYGDGGAFRDPESPYRPWYQFRHYPHDYESWWGFKTLPNVNEADESYVEFICGENGVIRHWLRLGAAGFRLDVADELPDSFLDAIHRCIKGYDPDCVMLGEVWEDASNKVSYGVRRRYLLGGQFDSVMNYPFMNGILAYIRHGGGEALLETICQVLENYPRPVISSLMNMLSTHDTPRAITALVAEPADGRGRDWQEQRHYLSMEQYQRGCKLYVLASVILFGLPGMPCVYYGDEAGLSGYRDPFNRVCYPWRYQNGVLVAQIARLGELRSEYPVFHDADFEPMIFSDQICMFRRVAEDVEIYFAVNRSEESETLGGFRIPQGAEEFFLLGEYENGVLGPLSGVVLIHHRKEEENLDTGAGEPAGGGGGLSAMPPVSNPKKRGVRHRKSEGEAHARWRRPWRK